MKNIPLLYSKTGVCRGITIFLIFVPKHIDYGYSLEPPRRGGSNVYPQSRFEAKILKQSKFYSIKFSIFGPFENLSVFHGRVFVMVCVYCMMRSKHAKCFEINKTKGEAFAKLSVYSHNDAVFVVYSCI